MDRYASRAAPGHSAHPVDERPRASLDRRLAASTPVYVAATALLAAIIVWAPALGNGLAVIFVLGLSSCALGLVESSRTAAVGRRTLLPRSAPEWAALIAVAVIFLAAMGGSVASAVAGRPELCLPIAAAAFVLVAAGCWFSERTVRRAARPARLET
jgi:hypothetical protein